MRDILRFSVADIAPDFDALVSREAAGRAAPDRLVRLFHSALDRFEKLAAPVAIVAETDVTSFADVYRGEGLNEPQTPLAEIYPRAERLALFAATSGEALSAEIGELFRRGEPATGYALDVIASDATARLADATAQRFRTTLAARGAVATDLRTLPYSPGYCGWHVSGQRRLFAALQPGSIGVRLGASFLMSPLKSVSGVIVAGTPAVHRFRPTYPFCEDCTTHECRPRMASVLKRKRGRP